MKNIKFLLAICLSTILIYSCGNNPTGAENQETLKSNLKIVSLNGAISEIVSALGHEQEIVGRDVTSTYPESLKESAQDLGHVRTLSIESIIALNPDFIFASDKDINPELLSKIQESGIPFQVFEQKYTKIFDLIV